MGLQSPRTPDDKLAAVIGSETCPRTEMVKKLWAYIKEHNLQKPDNKRTIVCDEKLKTVFGKAEVDMFEMQKLLSEHITK